MGTALGSESHLQACARLSSLQVGVVTCSNILPCWTVLSVTRSCLAMDSDCLKAWLPSALFFFATAHLYPIMPYSALPGPALPRPAPPRPAPPRPAPPGPALSSPPLPCPKLVHGPQVIASLPRGATRRLYTAPHSLLDSSPAQVPRQLLDTVATTNVLLERARVSPVSSSAASSHSSESVKAADHQHTAAPALSARTPGTAAAAAAASSWRPVSNLHPLDQDQVSSQADSPMQFPSFGAPVMPASHTARPLTAERQSSFPLVESSPSQESVPAQRGFQQSNPEAGSAQQTSPVPDFTTQAHSFSLPALAAGNQPEGPGSDRHTVSANSSESVHVPGGLPQNSPRTTEDASALQAGPQQSHPTDRASNSAQVELLV